MSLASLSGDNLGTKIQKKYENRQKIRRERENINSHKIIDFSHFTDYIFSFYAFLFFVSFADAEFREYLTENIVVGDFACDGAQVVDDLADVFA